MWESIIIIPILLMKSNYRFTLTKLLHYETRIGIQSLFLICQTISEYQLATNSKTRDIFHNNYINILIEYRIFFFCLRDDLSNCTTTIVFAVVLTCFTIAMYIFLIISGWEYFFQERYHWFFFPLGVMSFHLVIFSSLNNKLGSW